MVKKIFSGKTRVKTKLNCSEDKYDILNLEVEILTEILTAYIQHWLKNFRLNSG